MFHSVPCDEPSGAGREREGLCPRVEEPDAEITHADQRGAEEWLRESEERFRLIVESARDYAIFTLDRHGAITTWNSGAERILGWAEAEIVGRTASLLYTPEDIAAGEPDTEMRTALAQGSAAGARWMLRRDGSRFWATQTMMRQLDAGGEASSRSCVIAPSSTWPRRLCAGARRGCARSARPSRSWSGPVSPTGSATGSGRNGWATPG